MRRLFASRSGGTAGIVIAVVRIAVGAFFVSVSSGKFFDHAAETVDFERYGVPQPDFGVYAVGTTGLVLLLFLVWSGSGALALDQGLSRRIGDG